MTEQERKYFEENLKDLHNPDKDKRKAAVIKLGNFKHIAAVPFLIQALKDNDLTLYIVSALGKIKDSKSVGALLNEFRSKNFLVQFKILNALEKIGDKRVIPYLRTLTQNEKVKDKKLSIKILNCINKVKGAVPT